MKEKKKELTQEQKDAVRAYLESRKRTNEKRGKPLFFGLLGYGLLVSVSAYAGLGAAFIYGTELTAGLVMAVFLGVLSTIILGTWLKSDLLQDSKEWQEQYDKHIQNWGWLLK